MPQAGGDVVPGGVDRSGPPFLAAREGGRSAPKGTAS